MTEKKIETLTTKQIAEALGTTPRELRVFLRASKDYSNAGSGGRYAFATKDVGPMKTRFTAWQKDREEARKAAVEKAAAEAQAAEESTPEAEEVTEDETPKPEGARPSTRRTRKTPAA
jgi:hypothetical protein